MYWAAWWIYALVMSVLLGAVLAFAFWIAAFYDANVTLLICFFFLVNLSVFSVVFAMQAVCFTRHQGVLFLTFVFLVMLSPHSVIEQGHLPVPEDYKRRFSFSAMVAAKETMNLLTAFSSFKYGLNFDNYNEQMNNYSVEFGMRMLGIDIIIYFLIGCALEACVFLAKFLL